MHPNIEKRMALAKERLESPDHTDAFRSLPFIMYGSNLKVPMHYALTINEICFEDIVYEENVELRSFLLSKYGFDKFIRNGGGECVKKAVDENDDQTSSIWKVKFNERGSEKEIFFIKLINSTVNPSAIDLTEEEKVNNGYTKEGFSIYVETIPHANFETMWDAVGWGFAKKPGEYCPEESA